jgi:hypothetical protein
VGIDFCTEQKSGLRHVSVDAVAKSGESGVNSGFNTFHRDIKLFEGGYRSGVVLNSNNCVS